MDEGYPAYAGMDPRFGNISRPSVRLPRLRGDGPAEHLVRLPLSWATPPTRGWTRYIFGRGWIFMGYPAYAGMDLVHLDAAIDFPGLPRLRGDGPKVSAADRVGPPGYPAYAGMDPGYPPAIFLR